jgi:hypothetical protein
MIGVGKIFAMYRDGILDADDEVALVYEPETYRKHSEPLVNLRAALTMATDAGVIDPRECADLLSQMRALYFPNRSHQALFALCPGLADYFTNVPLPDVKRDDAIELLQTLRQLRKY